MLGGVDRGVEKGIKGCVARASPASASLSGTRGVSRCVRGSVNRGLERVC